MLRLWMMQVMILLVAGNAMAQPFTLKGKLGKKAEGEKLILTYQKGAVYESDSTIVKNGKFSFSGELTEPVRAYLKRVNPDPAKAYLQNNPDNTELFLEPGKITLSSSDGKLSSAAIKGGPGQSDFMVLQQRLKPFNQKVSLIMDSMAKGYGVNDEAVQKYQKMYHEVNAEMRVVKAAFVPDYPDSYLSLSLVKEMSSIIDVPKFEPLFNALSERLRNTATAKTMAARLEIAKRTAVGQKALDFVLNDTTGKPVSLSSMKGKYVLVDFWASWCGPCRLENPFLVKAWEKYKNRNFQIIGVSLDSHKGSWEKAIREDGLSWIHVSDLKGGKNEAAILYDIKAVPQNFLVDPNGVIIAKNLRSHQLEEKLNEIYN